MSFITYVACFCALMFELLTCEALRAQVREKRGKSTAMHAAIVAPESTTIIDFDPASPDIPSESLL